MANLTHYSTAERLVALLHAHVHGTGVQAVPDAAGPRAGRVTFMPAGDGLPALLPLCTVRYALHDDALELHVDAPALVQRWTPARTDPHAVAVALRAVLEAVTGAVEAQLRQLGGYFSTPAPRKPAAAALAAALGASRAA